MKLFGPQHADLLEALRGEELIPRLLKRLSFERLEHGNDEVRRLRDWIPSLRDDPGWAIVEAQLDAPQAWPQAWVQARQAGFSDRSAHHHALLFWRLADRFSDEDDLDAAAFCLKECLLAWRQIVSGGYLSALLERLEGSPELADDLLLSMAQRRRDALQRALALDDTGRQITLERRSLRMAWRQLGLMVDGLPDSEAHGLATLRKLRAEADSARRETSLRIVERFETLVDARDLVDVHLDDLLEPFAWVAEIAATLGTDQIDDYALTQIIEKVVATGWKLRKIKRDGVELGRLLGVCAQLNEELFQRLVQGRHTAAFGHQSKCADFIVFQGEQLQVSPARKELFEAALEVCPGHRNASMLMSYELSWEVKHTVAQTRIQPAISLMVGMEYRSVRKRIEEAWATLARAERLYAFNEELDDVREQLRAEMARLKIDIPHDDAEGEAP